MRTTFCILAFIFGFVSVSAGAEDDKSRRQKEKPIQLPTFDFGGYSGKFSADQSRIWDVPDPSSQFQVRQSGAQPYFGMTFSRPLE